MSPAKNLLVMQSGGPTPVINRSLFGVCDEAAKSGAFAGIFGAHGGVEGVLSDRVFDLAAISPAAWPAIAAAPGAALGTTRKKFSDIANCRESLSSSNDVRLPTGSLSGATTPHRRRLRSARRRRTQGAISRCSWFPRPSITTLSVPTIRPATAVLPGSLPRPHKGLDGTRRRWAQPRR